MKILFVSGQLLFPASRFGGAKRLYNLASYLERNHDLRLICMDVGEETDLMNGDHGFRNYLQMAWPKPNSGLKGWLRAPMDWDAFILSKKKAVEKILDGSDFDAVLLAYCPALSVFGTLLGFKQRSVFYLEDDFTFEYMRIRWEEKSGPIRKVLRFLRFQQILRYYRKKLAHVTGFISISAEEEKVVQRTFPETKTFLLKYGIDLEKNPFLSPPSELASLGYIGNFRHQPNIDAAVFLLENIFPVLRQSIPNLKLILAGSGLTDEFKNKYHGVAGLSWMGDIPDIKDFYSRIGIFINPSISGRGMRTKLLEAAAFGRPILTTPLGAEGLDDLNLGIMKDAGDAAQIIKRLLNDPANYERIAKQNRETVENEYSLGEFGSRMEKILQGLA